MSHQSAPNLLLLLAHHASDVMPHFVLVTILVVEVLHSIVCYLSVDAVEWITSEVTAGVLHDLYNWLTIFHDH